MSALQVLSIDLGSDVLPALALGAEQPEPGIMSRPLRPPTEQLFNWAVVRRFCFLGTIQSCGVVSDENPPARGNPVAPARRSPSASAKAAFKTGPGKQPIRGFRDLIDHLATLTRDTISVGGQPVDKLAAPTPTQRRAFDLIGAPIPLTLT